MLGVLLCGCGSGCAMLETTNPSSTQPTALSWLTNWVSQPLEMAAGFDLDEIKPPPAPVTVVPGNLLEVTVWDLYEPGKPYSFPVRVSDGLRIEAPLIGDIGVEHRTISQVEAALADGYRKGDYLLNPRILVRSLDAPVVKVHVTGAVNRPGYVEMTRADRSVYAAILSAGGLNKMAGTQVAVTRAALASIPDVAIEHAADRQPAPEPVVQDESAYENAGEPDEGDEPHVPVQRANSVEDLSVSPSPPVVRPAPGNRGLYSVFDNGFTGAADSGVSGMERQDYATEEFPPPRSRMQDERARPPAAQNPETAIQWYDASHARDRDQLKAIVLGEGDIVTIKTAAQPLRIGGMVNRPGAYPLPPGRSLNAWQAIELAGGVRDEGVPLNITMLRPAAEGRSARRWTLSVASYQQHPTPSPLVEPGDELHVEPTTGSKIKRAVRDVWSKP